MPPYAVNEVPFRQRLHTPPLDNGMLFKAAGGPEWPQREKIAVTSTTRPWRRIQKAAIRLGVPDLLSMIPHLPEPNRFGRVLSLAEQIG